MTILEKVKSWVESYAGLEGLGTFSVDALGPDPPGGGVYPLGLAENKRQTDIMGNTAVWDRYRFMLRFRFEQAAGAESAEAVMGFQEWVQEQCVRGFAPRFGDADTEQETVEAGNGQMTAEDGTGATIYTVELSIQFKKFYEVI